MAYATAADIEDRLGRPLDASESTIVETRLADIEEFILLRIPDLDQKVLEGTIRQRLVVMVECEAVMRLIRNPDGYTQETDGSYSYSISSDVASGRLSITDDEWRMLGIRRAVAMIAPRIAIPTQRCGRHPDADFGPQIPHTQEHPAVWWGDDNESS